MVDHNIVVAVFDGLQERQELDGRGEAAFDKREE